MRTPCTYDYAVIRVVPRVEREEFVNVGVIVSCPAQDFLDARIELDAVRLPRSTPTLDLDTLRAHLARDAADLRGRPAAGPLGALSPRERFRWLTAPRSAIIQMLARAHGPVRRSRCAARAPARRMVRTPKDAP